MTAPLLVVSRGRVAPISRLVCLPYAGGGATAYRPWRRWLPDEVELVIVAPPGREARVRERPFLSIVDYAAAVAAALDELPPLPTDLFGHSMGAMVAFQLASGAAVPPVLRTVVLSGAVPPDSLRTHVRPFPAGKADGIAELRRLGGTPQAVLDNDELLEHACECIAGDVALLLGYADEADHRPCDASVVVMAAVDDEVAPWQAMTGWEAFTGRPGVDLRYHGGHFFPWAATTFPADLVGLLMPDRGPAEAVVRPSDLTTREPR